MQRNAVATGKQLWPGGVIPYTVDMFFRQEGKMNHVRQWMNMVEYLTCLRFVERTWEEHYIHIYSGIGCYSYVGRIGGEQALSLGRECLYEGTVVHELLHAAGLYHMHSRPDRDEYLDILWNNIDPEYIDHFDKYSAEDVDSILPFDTKSVMLYSADAFALHPGLTTMKVKDGSDLPAVYNKTGLSDNDILSIGMLYNCSR
ncbi:zinc metalloproteinase nas-6-like [Rhipicephalus microplus]|uniref:zinc metalloproteinase nas-6-like n=1 Tax=Rhipicephalus microplus TaxID=6941 RepID=UPI003F6CFFE7